ncbi:MAG TPA: DUF4342 domain-containing protein [Armatimonadota bacterium]
MTKTFTEEMKVTGEQLVQTIKNLIQEGNVRRITLKNREGHTILTLPLTVGVIGAVISPMLAAVGAVAALVTECTITVERAAP